MKKIKEYFYLLPALMFIITAIVKFTTPSAEIAKSAPAGMAEKMFYLGVLQLPRWSYGSKHDYGSRCSSPCNISCLVLGCYVFQKI
jgi:hypothetical protein